MKRILVRDEEFRPLVFHEENTGEGRRIQTTGVT